MAKCIYLFNEVEYKYISDIKMFPQKHCNLITGKYKITKSFEACCLLVHSDTSFFNNSFIQYNIMGSFKDIQKTPTPL